MVFSDIISALVAWSIAFVQAYGPWSVFFIVILEEVFVPIPSPLVIMGATFVLVEQSLPLLDAIAKIFLVIVLPASIASVIGSFFVYGIGYYGGERVVKKFGRFIGISWDDLQKTEKKMEDKRRTWFTIAGLRAVPFFPISVVSFTSGVLRLSWKKYAVATFIGSIPRIFILAIIGWFVGIEYTKVADQIGAVEDIILIGIAIGVIYLLWKHRKHINEKILKRKPKPAPLTDVPK